MDSEDLQMFELLKKRLSPERLELSLFERPPSAAAVWMESTTNLALIPLRINMASHPTASGGQSNSWPKSFLTKWDSR